MAHSLRGRLLWWLLLPLAVFVLIAGAMSYDTARTTAALVQDSALVASARTIGEDVEWRNGRPGGGRGGRRGGGGGGGGGPGRGGGGGV
ncbi:sensor histidine kinase N-terminal domain-containing protein, partial [Burkholderia contaminans]|uniref:sensor histidine kinase N-terminal domain-containing protein n=1 Tax=Burkholderia contaminans TaxID=488447 RepID=UPI0021BBD197